ncbi:MAG: hypothetical protein AUK47_27660 [Deltaproteobacteria bacterium CG2_30_63_29]|nr:MAG: hypothetical protein AUK47_27660 [Deltaproteobacteria bacterium CG2_30_63_29]PJB44850.1 MAG: hypothetical protein CO108_08185 [Deltaproteobacteria bacterium CG_4_9_14_3_um_filter_63_12]
MACAHGPFGVDGFCPVISKISEASPRDLIHAPEPTMKRILAACTLLTFFNLACYSTYTISKDELKLLESGQESENVVVKDVEGEPVQISPETPLEVLTNDGTRYRVTPYNFLLSESQLVSPDYDLLLPADAVSAAEVRQISYGKTFGLVGTIVVAVGGGFAALLVLQ